MRCDYACGSPEHGMHRRAFLGGVGATLLGGFATMIRPAGAKALASAQKRVLVIDLAGGVSQLETWDPKPNTDTGGPFRAIPTSVPGIHISELLPHSAKVMHHLTLVRSINTKEDDHGKGRYFMERGRRQQAGAEYPHLGSVFARFLAPADSPLPGYIHIHPGGGGSNKQDAAFLGPRYAAIGLGNGQPPANVARPAELSEDADTSRNRLRLAANERFGMRRRTSVLDAYNQSYDQAEQLMRKQEVFDLAKEPASELERYGAHDFGRHCLLARRLLEHDVTFVKVTHSNYDTHFENFDFHLEQLGEFDRPFATLIGDLADRGLLQSTLVIVMSEFGRTPNINAHQGRDHWGTAWSVCLAGTGLQAGAAFGKTNENGTAVADKQVDAGHLFHTYLRAVGLDPSADYPDLGRSIPIGDPAAKAIEEILA